MAVDVAARGDLPFPRSRSEFQRLFPDEAACAAYLKRARWSDGFIPSALRDRRGALSLHRVSRCFLCKRLATPP